MKSRFLTKLFCGTIACFVLGIGSIEVNAANWMPDHQIPAYQQKDIFETETVTVSGISVEEVVNDTVSPVITKKIEKDVKFVIFNSTKQEIEQEVSSKDGMLPELELVKNHNYIIWAEDSEYKMENAYIWVKGNQVVDIKHYQTEYDYPVFEGLRLYQRDTEEANPENDRRVFVNIPVQTEGGALLYNVKIDLVSDVETISTSSGSKGKIRESLLEDVNYMVVVEHDEYDVASFPIAVKDKSEYGAGKYPYDHSSCARVDNIVLVNKKDAHKNDSILTNTNYDEVYQGIYTNIAGNTTVTGMNFKDFLVLEKELDKNVVTGLGDKDYKVFDIKVVNPHRWEVAKLAAGQYEITKGMDEGEDVTAVYYMDGEKNLHPIEFNQSGKEVTFSMNSMSLYPIVIAYEKTEVTPPVEEPGEKPEDQPAGKPNDYKATLKNEADAKGKIPLAEGERMEELEVVLTVKDTTKAVDTPEKSAISEKLGSNKLATFFDVALFKKISGGGEERISQTTGEIEITLEVPEEFRNQDANVARTYKVMRNHNGVVDILSATYNKETHFITFKTDKFSTYALVYSDSVASTTNSSTTSTTPQTGDMANPYVYMALIGISLLLAGTAWKKKRVK